jgi:hypothetical protein
MSWCKATRTAATPTTTRKIAIKLFILPIKRMLRMITLSRIIPTIGDIGAINEKKIKKLEEDF